MSYLAPEPEPKSVTFQLRNVWNFADMSNLLDNSYMEYLFTCYFYNILWWSVVEGHRCSLWSEVKSTYPVRSVISVFELPTQTLISHVRERIVRPSFHSIFPGLVERTTSFAIPTVSHADNWGSITCIYFQFFFDLSAVTFYEFLKIES